MPDTRKAHGPWPKKPEVSREIPTGGTGGQNDGAVSLWTADGQPDRFFQCLGHQPRMDMSITIKVITSAFILFLLATLFCMDVVPPRSLTATRMHVTKSRILHYGHLHNRLPATLAELQEQPGRDNDTVDAWGRPLDFSVDESGAVTLRSLGADRLPGGEGDNRDMTGVFMSRDAQNRWQEAMTDWTQNPARPSAPPLKNS